SPLHLWERGCRGGFGGGPTVRGGGRKCLFQARSLTCTPLVGGAVSSGEELKKPRLRPPALAMKRPGQCFAPEDPVLQRLFVYGTLAPGRENADVLAELPGTWEEATVRGRLLQEGWGADLGYPGLVLDDAGDEVQGLVFTSDRLADHLDRLDAFGGCGY